MLVKMVPACKTIAIPTSSQKRESLSAAGDVIAGFPGLLQLVYNTPNR